MLLSVIFFLSCALMILASYNISKNIINVSSVFTAPYMILVPLNNLFMVKRGFYSISNDVIYLILISLFLIFIGYSLANIKRKVKLGTADHIESGEFKFKYYNMDSMLKYVCFVDFIILIRFLYNAIRYGFFFFTTEEFEGYIMRGILGHLLITTYPLVPILFFYWLKNKSEINFLLVCSMSLFLFFCSYVKYHIIGMVVLIFLFVVLEDKSYLKKGTVTVVVASSVIFVFNYFLAFLVRGTFSEVSTAYYGNHLWNYMCGSLINDNYIFIEQPDRNMYYSVLRIIMTPIHSFLVGFFNVNIFADFGTSNVLFHTVGSNAELSNVTDFFGTLFPVNNGFFDKFVYGIFLIVVGMFFSVIYNTVVVQKNRFCITACVLLDFFVFLSFFGIFYTLLPPWEILAYSVFIPKLFERKELTF